MTKFEKNTFELKCKLNCEKRWMTLLAKKNENTNLPLHYIPFDTDKINIESFFAIDNEGTRKVFLSMPQNIDFKQDKRSASIQVLKSVNEFLKEKKQYIEICCLNPDKSEFIYNKFNTLISMIFTTIKYDNLDNYTAVKKTIQEWRDFLRMAKKRFLKLDEIRGLIGELHFLNDLLNIDKSLFESWHGPESERHDFRRNDVSIEVKTSSSKNKKTAVIGSVEQLEMPDNSELYCQFYQLEQDDKGFSIPALIDNIKNNHDISEIDIERKLNDLNYDFNDRKYYEEEKNKFRILNNNFFTVNDNFPRVISKSFKENKVPRSVTNLSYTIDLSGLDEIQFEEKERILTKMVK